jgi:hypothetical protein
MPYTCPRPIAAAHRPGRLLTPHRLQPRVQVPGQGLLAAALGHARPDRGQHRRARRALGDRHRPGLGVRGRGLAGAGAGAGVPERRGVRPGIRDVPFQAVHAHLPPRPQERPRRVFRRHRPRDLRERLLHRLMPEPLPCLRQPARRHRALRRVPAAPVSQGLRQPDPGLLVVLGGEKRQRHREIHHDMRRQLPALALHGLAGRLDRLIDRVPRYPGRQHAQGDPVAQAALSHTASLRHNPRSCRQPAETPRSDTPGQIKINLN